VPRDRRLATEVPPNSRVTIPCAGRSDVTSGPPASNPKGPRSWRYLELHATSRCRLPWLTCCCVTEPPDCQRAHGGHRTGPAPAPARRPEGRPGRTGHPPTVAAALAAGQGARPSLKTAAPRARRGETRREQVNRPTATPPRGRRVGRISIPTDRSWSSTASEPTRGAGGGHARPHTRGSVPMRPRSAGPGSPVKAARAGSGGRGPGFPRKSLERR
jgi:hypothetical protein